MKKILVLATAAFLFSGVAFSQGSQKPAKATTKKECCKKGDKKDCKKDCKKDAKCCQKTKTAKKA